MTKARPDVREGNWCPTCGRQDTLNSVIQHGRNQTRQVFAVKLLNDPDASDETHLLALIVLQLIEISEKIS